MLYLKRKSLGASAKCGRCRAEAWVAARARAKIAARRAAGQWPAYAHRHNGKTRHRAAHARQPYRAFRVLLVLLTAASRRRAKKIFGQRYTLKHIVEAPLHPRYK